MIKILLVDDEPTLLKILAWRLETQGFKINPASSAEEALDKYQQAKPDLIISDIRMPGRDGICLIKEIQNQDPNIPCILMSGHSDFNLEKETHKIIKCDFIAKPINFDKLIHLIKQHF